LEGIAEEGELGEEGFGESGEERVGESGEDGIGEKGGVRTGELGAEGDREKEEPAGVVLGGALGSVLAALSKAGAYTRPLFGSLSTLCGIGGAFMSCFGDVRGVPRGY